MLATKGDEEIVGGGRLTAADENLVCPVLISQLRSIALAWFLPHTSQSTAWFLGPGRSRTSSGVLSRLRTYEFDGDLLVVQEVGSLEDNTKGALADLLPHSVVNADDI